MKAFSPVTVLKRRMMNIFWIGLAYMLVEVMFSALTGSLVGVHGIQFISLCGKTSLWMWLVGGISGALIGQLNEYPSLYKRSILSQCLLGTCIVLVVEFVSGYILNVRMGLHIWDYSDLPFNIMGQICLPFGLLWFLLCPAAIWLDDAFSYIFYNIKDDNYKISAPYKQLVNEILNKAI